MKIARFSINGAVHYGIVEKEQVLGIQPDIFSGIVQTGDSWPVEKVKLLAPVVPGKALCVGLNYRKHIAEMDFETPQSPVIFLKANSSLQNPGDPVEYPLRHTKRMDYEGELVVVIGKKARNVSEEDALSYVLGYTCGNDLTARDLQTPGSQWAVCKSFDTFMPIGPWIETQMDWGNLAITTRVNGEVRQSSNTNCLIFSIPYLIHYLSSCMTLHPGDILFTGTPDGVGAVVPGDRMEVEIAGIGILSNTVV